jgi:hypothetical protein
MNRWLTYSLILLLGTVAAVCVHLRYHRPLAAYARVQPGMTLDEVTDELGPYDIGAGGLWSFSYFWVRPGCHISVDFETENGVPRVHTKRIEYSHSAPLPWPSPW